MKATSDRFSTAEEGSVVADLLRAILLFMWGVVRVPILMWVGGDLPISRLVYSRTLTL